jgi:hypothetical protein
VAIFLRLHRELNILMKSVQVIKEFRQLVWSMQPDDECVIHVAKPAEGLIGRRLQSHFFKVFHEIVCNDRGERRTHRQTVLRNGSGVGNL